MVMTAILSAPTDAFWSSAQDVGEKAKTPEQACQAQGIDREGVADVLRHLLFFSRATACLLCLHAPVVFEDNRTARLLGGTDVLTCSLIPKTAAETACCSDETSAECTCKDHLEAAHQGTSLPRFRRFNYGESCPFNRLQTASV